MSKRTRNIFSPTSDKPYKLSRYRIDLFLRCKRCFYLDRRWGIDQPPTFPYTLNNAVDTLLKKEFDRYRLAGKAHHYMVEHGIDAVPFAHPKLDGWRMSQRGVQYLHKPTNLLIMGAVDDVWITPAGELIVVDYKATSTTKEILIDNRLSYKRQIEIYQWLLRKNNFNVSSTAYFVYCNGDASGDNFINMLQFNVSLIPYTGNDAWIESVLYEIKECLMSDILPEPAKTCDHCNYWLAIKQQIDGVKSF